MCGICGRYDFGKRTPVPRGLIGDMTKTMTHRGPDDEGYYQSGPLGFGFRRLSIIDLEGGHQPMSDQEETIWVIFNGEIYNFPELRKELESFGHVFRTRSDTEVIVHGYKQWGNDVFHHLNGMFGVAIWDDRNKRLILARDPMGIKLVYYKIEDGVLYFGSEIRPIRSATHSRHEIDLVALNLFFRYRYTPSPLTLLRGIRKLAAGTMLIIENGESRLERWYRFKPGPSSRVPTDDEAREELLELYKQSMRRHLISDVPVGILLSGGVDSGLLLGLMKIYGSSWPTFSIGYGRSFRDDELTDAARSAEYFSSPNVSIELDNAAFEAALPKIVSVLEEPIASSSIVPMYFVCERARQDVKVALMGQGPDELFGGYRRHIGVRYGSYWRDLPEWVRKPITRTIDALPRNETLKRGAYALNLPERMKRYQHAFSIMPGQTIDGLFQEGSLPADAGDEILECWSDLVGFMEHTDELGGFQFLELRSSLPDELLMYADKISMAHGLEVRIPYLDREIVEYVENLPENFKVRKGHGKWLHRQVCKQYLPKSILKRKKKGFAVNVVDEWFHRSMNKNMENIFLDGDSHMYKYLRKKVVGNLLSDHVSGNRDNHKILFSLIMFEEWLRKLS
jgi:asparagine synthase (glutamine-hydrolysing)